MFMEKVWKEIKLHACAEIRGGAQRDDRVFGYITRNHMLNYMDTVEANRQFNPYSPVQMSRM